MRALIGVELLRKLPPGPCDIRDVKLRGFVLRVRPSGTHTYFANYNRSRWLKLGTTATLTAPEAREGARNALAEASLGADPIADRKAADGRISFEEFLTKHYEPWATALARSAATLLAFRASGCDGCARRALPYRGRTAGRSRARRPGCSGARLRRARRRRA